MKRGHRVEEYFAGSLDERAHTEFERHLPACGACQEGLEQIRRLDASLAVGLRQTLPSQEPRPEWVSRLREQFRPAPRPQRWLALGGIPAVAAALVLALLVVFQPWGGPLTPEQHLDRVYTATLEESFRGQFTIMDGDSPAMTGTFARSADGSWAISAMTATGDRLEEVQVDGQVWRRQNGEWVQAQGLPLYISADAAVVGRLPDLLRGVPSLSEIQPSSPEAYIGEDSQYVARLLEGVPGSFLGIITEGPPPRIEVWVADGKIGEMRLSLEAPGRAPVVVDLVMEEYGVPVHIEAP